MARAEPESERPYECVSPWAVKVPPLKDIPVIPTEKGHRLDGKEDKRAGPDFLDKNVLLWTHISLSLRI